MKSFIQYCLLLLVGMAGFAACKKDENNNNSSNQYALRISNGAQSVNPDESITYQAVLIDKTGAISTPSNVSWSSSNTNVATISGNGQVTIASVGTTTIRASVSINGSTLTAEAPLSVRAQGVFMVAPWAILVDTEFPDIQLEPVYLGTGSTAYTYTSSNTSIATVSASGVVNFVAAGSCEITVTATGLDGQPSVIVPVVVLGVPTVELPVARITLSPASHNIFKTETAQFNARAYKADGSEVTTTMTWSVEDPAIASVSQSGVVTGLAVGETKVRVEAQGIVAEAAVYVAPTKTLVITPYYTTIAPSGTRQFSAQLYNVSRNSNGDFVLTAGVTPSNLHWEIPTYGFSMFDIATVNQQGLVTMKSDAMPSMMTVLLVSDPNNTDTEAGAASIGVAVGSGCNCGTRDAAAASLRLSSASSVTLSMGQTHQIQADVLDANGNVLSNAAIEYCSSDIQVADVDATGEISATAFLPNTATITVCHGNLSRTVTVNVQ